MSPALRRADLTAARALLCARSAAFGACVAVACLSCDAEPAATAAASSSSSAAVSAPSSASTSSRHYLKRAEAAKTPSCRVMGVEGTIHVAHSDKALKVGDLVDSEAWLDLGEAGSLSLKHTQTGREWSVRGPAWLRACVDGQEALWLARGELRIGTGAGVRPGAQVVVSTPHGIVRWGDATLSIKVEAKQTSVAVAAGRAWLSPAQATKLAGAAELGAKQSAKLIAQGVGATRTQRLVAACEADSTVAEQLARELLGAGKPGPSAGLGVSSNAAPRPPSSAPSAASPKKLGLGERARDQAAARARARESCAIAWASVGALDSQTTEKPSLDPAFAAQPYAARLSKADAAWRRVPFGDVPQPTDQGE